MDSLGSLNAFVRPPKPEASRLRDGSLAFVIGDRQVSGSDGGRLGVRLFHRSTRSITLTAEGALFLIAAGASFLKSKQPSLSCRRHTRPRAARCVSVCHWSGC